MLQFGAKIGEGVYSEVYQVTGEGPEAVLKLCFNDSGSFSLSVREVDVVSRCHKHRNVVKVVGTTKMVPQALSPRDPGCPKFIDPVHLLLERGSESLTQYIDREKPKRYYQNLRKIMYELLSGLEFVHSRRVIHRDLKPDNIIIFNRRETVEAKLSDFGISKVHCESIPNSPEAVTISYRAPEIAMERAYDMKSDVWSLGCIFHDLLCKSSYGYFSACSTNQRLLVSILNFLPDTVPLDSYPETASLRVSSKTEKPPVAVFFSSKTRKLFEKYVGDPSVFADLLSHMLTFDPEKRFSSAQCLAHPFFKGFQETPNEALKRNYAQVIEYSEDPNRDIMRRYVHEQLADETDVRAVNVLFETAILVDRYLLARAQGAIKEYPIQTVIYTLRYLALKYAYVMTAVPPFETYFHLEEPIAGAADLEYEFTCVLYCGRYYVDTPIDFASKITSEEATMLLQRYLDDPSLRGKKFDELT